MSMMETYTQCEILLMSLMQQKKAKCRNETEGMTTKWKNNHKNSRLHMKLK